MNVINKQFAWSYSALTSFELCPAKWDYEKRHKPDFSGGAAVFGKMVHKKFELYVQDGAKLPLDLQHHKPRLDKLKAMGEILAEQKLCLTKRFQPTGWFDDDAWVRGIVDFAAVTKQGVGIICDYKTGKRRLNWEQVQMQAAMLDCYDLELEGYLIGYYWTKAKKFDVAQFRREDITKLWLDILPRAKKMEEDVAEQNFPSIQNFLCRKYCSNKNCRYHGG